MKLLQSHNGIGVSKTRISGRLEVKVDILAGLLLLGFAAGLAWFGRSLTVGSSSQMGPGYLPHILTCLIGGLGGIILVKAVLSPGATVSFSISYPLAAILTATLSFAALVEHIGLLISAFLLVGAVSFCNPKRRMPEILVISTALALFVNLLFPVIIGIDIKVLPSWR
jgi:hypothetical protein